MANSVVDVIWNTLVATWFFFRTKNLLPLVLCIMITLTIILISTDSWILVLLIVGNLLLLHKTATKSLKLADVNDVKNSWPALCRVMDRVHKYNCGHAK